MGPFQGPTGALKGPKTAPRWSKISPKWLFMAPNVLTWPQMALKHFPWVYYMNICHVGPPWGHLGTHGGPLNGPKQHQKGLEWLKITRMAQNVTAWLQMTLNTSNGYITWLYVMLDHPGPFSEAHGGPIMAQNSTKNGPSWPKMALHDRKWP